MATKICPNCGEEKEARGFHFHVKNCKAVPEEQKAADDQHEGIIEEPKKQENKLFHNLEEDRIRLEEAQRKRDEELKKRAEELEALEKVSSERKPYLKCPFCANIQYEISSRERGTAWCLRCGKAFMEIWK